MILIVGGAGYIGSHLNKKLWQRGYETIVLDNLDYGYPEWVKWGKLVQGNMEDTKIVSQLFEDYPIELVVCHAASPMIRSERSERYYSNNIMSVTSLLDIMLDAPGLTDKNFIFSSTSEVYGIPNKIPIDENHTLEPIHPYGDSKRIIENILEDYREFHGLNYTIFRYFNVAGADPEVEIGEAHDPETHLIPLIMDAALGYNDHIKIWGTDYDTPDGTCIRDYIHVSHLAEAHILAYEKQIKKGKSDCFNLCSGVGYSVREVIDRARELTNTDIKVVEAERRRGDIPCLIGNPTKADTALGWKSRSSKLNEILQTAWSWQKSLREI